MILKRLALLSSILVSSFLLTTGAIAQQGPAPGGQQASHLPDIYMAQHPVPSGTNVVLVGTITTAGAAGSISLSAAVNGQSQIQLQLPSGSETETRSISRFWRAGTWTDSSGAAHHVPPQDLMGPHPAWFYPSFVLMSGLGSPEYVSSDLGVETRNGISVEHIAVWQLPISALPASSVAYVKQQTQYDIYVDPSTWLPVAITFNRQFDPTVPIQFLAPAQTSSAGVLEEVRYSNYQQVQGIPVAFHLQVFFQGTLHSDIQISSAKFNPTQASAEAK
jgi:hypothetical protein